MARSATEDLIAKASLAENVIALVMAGGFGKAKRGRKASKTTKSGEPAKKRGRKPKVKTAPEQPAGDGATDQPLGDV